MNLSNIFTNINYKLVTLNMQYTKTAQNAVAIICHPWYSKDKGRLFLKYVKYKFISGDAKKYDRKRRYSGQAAIYR